jgi:hypothetical protein
MKDIKKKTVEIHELLTDEQRSALYKWLKHTDPSPIHNRAQKQYESGTGDWILQSPKWTRWLAGQKRCLWIYGIPGAGKTILASHLNEQLLQHCNDNLDKRKFASVYYYCYFGHNQDEAVPFLRWLLSQLCRQAVRIPADLYQMHKHGREPSLIEFLSALKAAVDNFDGVYILIDALDESMPRDDLLRVLRDLITDPRFRKIQLLATSRLYIDIERIMGPLSESVSMSNDLVTEAIRRYVRSALHSNHRFKHWPRDLLQETVEALAAGANGM